MADIKLIFFDMDLTMLNNEGKVSDNSYAVLERAWAEGIKLVPVSGRSFDALLTGIDNFDYFDYVACTNGTVIHDAKTQEMIKRYSLDNDLAVKYIDYFDTYNKDNYVVVNGYYLGKNEFTQFLADTKYRNNEEFEYLLKTYREKGLREILSDDRYKVDKVIANFNNILLRGRLYDELHLMNKEPEVVVTSSHITNIEIFAKNSGKDVAIREIARMYGIDMKDVMAIGDNDNDVEMLKAAGLSVAMGNATDSAKKVADFVTKTNDEDGAVFAIEKLVLDKKN